MWCLRSTRCRWPGIGNGTPRRGQSRIRVTRICRRNVSATAAKIRAALTSEQLTARPGVIGAYTASASALLAVLSAMATQTEVLAGQVEQGFGQHPDAEIYHSQPGLGLILGARVLAEFGDDPDRYVDAKARKNYSGMSPITKASGTKPVVLARFARNHRLGDALFLQAFSALNNSPGARAFYDRQRTRGATHHQALRALANRLVGILHRCLRTHTLYDEHHAWHTQPDNSARQLDRIRSWDV
jgi:Transposase IS116/IS110/IS902 family